MADVSAFNGAERPRVNWGKWTLIAIGALFGAAAGGADDVDFRRGLFQRVRRDVEQLARSRHAARHLADGLDRADHRAVQPGVRHVAGVAGDALHLPGRQLLLTLIDILFAVSPVVAGLIYLLFYGSNGLLGGWLDAHNIQIMFSWPGMVLVTFSSPALRGARAGADDAQPGQPGRRGRHSAGASGWQMFRRVTLPNICWALLYGVVLTNARAIGEFGAVSVVSGSIRGETPAARRCRSSCCSRITTPSAPLPPPPC